MARHRTWLKRSVGMLTLPAILVLAACSDSDSPPASTAAAAGSDAMVTVRLFQFQPSPVVVAPGTTVTWTNRDDILHTVTSGTPDAKDGRFDGPMSGPGAAFAVTFSEPGTYAYFCTRHESMRGEVHVQ